MEEIVLLGFGGHSKSVIDTIERQNEYKIIGVLEKKKKGKQNTEDIGVLAVMKSWKNYLKVG